MKKNFKLFSLTLFGLSLFLFVSFQIITIYYPYALLTTILRFKSIGKSSAIIYLGYNIQLPKHWVFGKQKKDNRSIMIEKVPDSIKDISALSLTYHVGNKKFFNQKEIINIENTDINKYNFKCYKIKNFIQRCQYKNTQLIFTFIGTDSSMLEKQANQFMAKINIK